MNDDDRTMRPTDPLRELGKQLPYDRPDADRRDALRSSLLVAASEGERPSGRRRWLLVGGGFAAGALAAAAVAIVVLRPAPGEAPRDTAAPFARIESSSAAELERAVVPTSTGRDELVRVRAGKVRLAMPAVRSGDHVRVLTADAEVEGTGAYEVVVTHDALASVTVRAGTATVRVKQQQAVFLAAGQTWQAPVVTAELPAALQPEPVPAPQPQPEPPPHRPVGEGVAPRAVIVSRTPSQPRLAKAPNAIVDDMAPPFAEPPTAPPPVAAPPPVTAPAQPSVTAPQPQQPPVTDAAGTERRFRAGWALLRASKFSEAATELGAAADGDGPLAIDARYFQAVALIRAGNGTDAERALVRFLDHAPTSTRRGRASIMLARLLAERGDMPSARAWFETAMRDADPTVAAAAKAGLDSLPH